MRIAIRRDGKKTLVIEGDTIGLKPRTGGGATLRRIANGR